MNVVLLLRFWREASIGALVLIVVAACHARDVAIAERGRALERVRVADSTLAVVRPALTRVETKLVRDTVRVRVAVDRLVTLRDTVLAHIHDTTIVRTFVTRADSAASACLALSNDCQAFKAYATQTIAALESKLTVTPDPAKPRRQLGADVLKITIGGAIGFLAGRQLR